MRTLNLQRSNSDYTTAMVLYAENNVLCMETGMSITQENNPIDRTY